MIIESLIIQGVQIISSALTTTQRLESVTEERLMITLTAYALLSLIISCILLFWTRAQNRHVAELTKTNQKLRQENSELKQNSI